MKETKNIVISVNAGIVLAITVILNVLAYDTNEAKGIGYMYFAVIFLSANILLLAILAMTGFLSKKNVLGKDYIISILISLGIFIFTFIFFWLINRI